MSDEDRLRQIQPISTVILEKPPSCLQFSAVDPTYFVVGTYHLEADQVGQIGQVRKGSIILYQLVDLKA